MVKWGDRQREVLQLIWELGGDGITPSELMEKLGLSSKIVAAVYLSRWKRQGILLKHKIGNGCRYCVSTKGERKLAYLQSLKEE